ncbi:hypothetical protein E5288_WYG005625 [Bos mutus]|uniref:GDNF/GAS1 domain-containing protein n=1 Tax=Bos mutus TaxID=72004 RepID=A0A6B0RLE2_9CETA|nr:hypothetical protein [Bos mutus]
MTRLLRGAYPGSPPPPQPSGSSRRDRVVRPSALELEGGARDPGGRVSAPPSLRGRAGEVVGGAGDHLPTEGRFTNSCIQARRKCQADPTCNATYHYLNSCASSISTSSPAEEPLVPEDCMEAAQQLRNSSLMSCTCHRRMKNQATCLDIYWTIHPARSLGDYELDVSPYEDTVTRKPWKMNLSKLNMLIPDSDLCLKFAMLCTLNDKCDRLRKAYGEACSGSRCQRHTCQRQLRAFFEKASEPHSQGLLLCPCAPTDQGCGQRRRNTIAPSCALPSEAPNCLELRHVCITSGRFSDPLPSHGHPRDLCNRAVQMSAGIHGADCNINASVALSCTCRGSGNLQEECERLEESFSHNPCLKQKPCSEATALGAHSFLLYSYLDSALESLVAGLPQGPSSLLPHQLTCCLQWVRKGQHREGGSVYHVATLTYVQSTPDEVMVEAD